MPGGIENRRNLRLSAMGPVEAMLPGGGRQIAYLASIGRGGLGLYLPREAGVDQVMLMSLHLLAREVDPDDLQVVARVRWARELASLWMAGCSFEQMSDARYGRLLQHLHIIETWQHGARSTEYPVTWGRFTARE